MNEMLHDDLNRNWRDWIVDVAVWISMSLLALDGWLAYLGR
jgi:hypothetical protein